LATVDALVRQLGGEVRLENRLDRSGVVAIVALPVAPTETVVKASLEVVNVA
jgi:hypothetical protein